MTSSLLALASGLAYAADVLSTAASDVYKLGETKVLGQNQPGTAVGGSMLPQEEMWKFNRNTLPDAVNLLPGGVSSNTSGVRNEGLINVRGFDRFKVPLSIDGIRCRRI